MKWDKQFAVQLAKDYPKSFVRSLEFHIGDNFYKEKNYTEYDIGGFKEQLQVKIQWKQEVPVINIKEFFNLVIKFSIIFHVSSFVSFLF